MPIVRQTVAASLFSSVKPRRSAPFCPSINIFYSNNKDNNSTVAARAYTRPLRSFSSTPSSHSSLARPLTNTNMEVELTAPNGRKWSQPLGLFINNEFVKSSNEQKLTTINPA